MINLPSEIFDNVIVVHAPEDLSADAAGPFAAHMATLERDSVVLDVDNTETLDSAGLTALVDVQDVFRARGGQMKISTSNPTNRKILEVTRLDQQIEVYPSVIDAVRSFQ